MACGGGAEAGKRDGGGRGEWRGQDLFAWLLLRDGYTAQPSFPKSNATQLEDQHQASQVCTKSLVSRFPILGRPATRGLLTQISSMTGCQVGLRACTCPEMEPQLACQKRHCPSFALCHYFPSNISSYLKT